MYVKDYKPRKASMPGPPQRLSLQQWQLERERATRARECVCFWVCAACSDVLAWSAKREQSPDVFEELWEKEEEEEEEEKKKVFVHGLWSSPRRWLPWME